MIIVTGGAGFIGTNMVRLLNEQGKTDIIIVDKLRSGDKWKNLRHMKYEEFVDKDEFFAWFTEHRFERVEAIIHLGACSATTEKNADYLMQNNVNFSKRVFQLCKQYKIPLIYASSAATYGDGKSGFDDKNYDLFPLNMYGYSKKIFDDFVLKNYDGSFQCVGLKFFNVYGPFEYHKGEMASVVLHSYRQIRASGKIELFKSDRKEIAAGEQKRDFVYVGDVVKIISFFLQKKVSGIFNVGTGYARSFNDLAKATFAALKLSPNIKYKEMPEHLRGKYQYFTQADINKLQEIGYSEKFTSLEDGISLYVAHLQEWHDK